MSIDKFNMLLKNLSTIQTYEASIGYNTNEAYHLISNDFQIIKSLEKLHPFMESSKSNNKSLVSIYSYLDEIPLDLKNFLTDSDAIVIDTSLYKDQRTNGKKYISEDFYVIHIDKTNTYILFHKEKNSIYLFNKALNFLELDTIRLLKSLVTIRQEKLGHIVLHASGVVLEKNKGVLFLGDSRNGKTSILLEFIEKFYGDMLSCDTSVLRLEEDKLIARGWPSNFSVSIGTIYDYNCLHKFIPKNNKNLTYNQAWEIYPKHVLNTFDVLDNACVQVHPEAEIGALVFLEFSTKSPVCIKPLEDFNMIKKLLKQVYLGSRDPLYPNWHNFWTIKSSEIDLHINNIVAQIKKIKLPTYKMCWNLGAEQLLRKIDILNKYNIKTVHLNNLTESERC